MRQFTGHPPGIFPMHLLGLPPGHHGGAGFIVSRCNIPAELHTTTTTTADEVVFVRVLVGGRGGVGGNPQDDQRSLQGDNTLNWRARIAAAAVEMAVPLTSTLMAVTGTTRGNSNSDGGKDNNNLKAAA